MRKGSKTFLAVTLSALVTFLLGGCAGAEGPVTIGERPAPPVLDPSTSPKKLNLGSGSNILEGYDNIDLYYEDPRVIKMDIRRLDYPDDSVDEVLASHVLEHLPFRDVDGAVEEMYRVLKPGGAAYVEVPDLEAIMRLWLSLPEEKRWGQQSKAFAGIFGSQEQEGSFHRTPGSAGYAWSTVVRR
jgi:SAM-dependent methyltransferase